MLGNISNNNCHIKKHLRDWQTIRPHAGAVDRHTVYGLSDNNEAVRGSCMNVSTQVHFIARRQF